jgi:hypothetical protein
MLNTRTNQILACCIGLALAFACCTDSMATTINWLNMAPTPFGSSVPNGSVFNLPGVGNVKVTYSVPTPLVDGRDQNPLMQNGNVPGYNWGAHEQFGVINYDQVSYVTTTQWWITYTFSGIVPANTLFVGVGGLGRTSSHGGGMSVATVNQNGWLIGDWTGGGSYGATQFTPGFGTFVMNNSVTGLGAIDPWWNSALGVVQILDPVSSLTIIVDQLPGDGVGVNIAAVPEPATMCLLGLGGLLLRKKSK